LIDLHAHVYAGVCPLSVSIHEEAPWAGATTVVSAGDAGAHTIEGFRQTVVDRARPRVLAFLHISTIGLAGFPVGEAIDLDYLNVDKAVRAARENEDIVVGIKVRQGLPVISGETIEPFRRALTVADRLGLPLMVHIGGAPIPIERVLDDLRPGDVVTHCFSPWANTLFEDGRLVPSARAARERGVMFDIGHGSGSFSFSVAESGAEEGFFPDTISTDLHSLSVNVAVGDMATTMTKLLSVGMPLQDVVAAATSSPARIINRHEVIGSLRVGAVADITVLSLVDDDPADAVDSFGLVRRCERILRVDHTIRHGVPCGSPFPHPGRLNHGRARD
jgi:dihydroorotase